MNADTTTMEPKERKRSMLLPVILGVLAVSFYVGTLIFHILT